MKSIKLSQDRVQWRRPHAYTGKIHVGSREGGKYPEQLRD